MITRFAPSPTGYLHLGHAYAAWVAWTAARKSAGTFLLRWEDIDPRRCHAKYETATMIDLRWLEMAADAAPMRQSARLPIYRQALERLRQADLLYPCFCTRRDIQREINQSDEAPQGPGGPIYPGICRALPPDEARGRLAQGKPHAWRLKMDVALERAGPLSWHDVQAGRQTARPELFGDVVLARKDTPTSYHLAVTVDDAEQGITLVTRGRDLFAATHVHRLLQALLHLPVPQWHHHRLICDSQGNRLAKRDAATTLRTLREEGATLDDTRRRLGIGIHLAD